MSTEEILATHRKRVKDALCREDLEHKRRILCGCDHQEQVDEDAPTALALFLQLQGRIG